MCAVFVVFAANFAVKVTRLKVKGLRASGDSAQPVPAYMLRAGSMRITGCKCCCAACCGARANVSCLLILFAVAVVVVLLVAAGAVAFVVIIRLLCNTHRYTQTHTHGRYRRWPHCCHATFLSAATLPSFNTHGHMFDGWLKIGNVATSTSTTAGNCQTGDADVDAKCDCGGRCCL